MKRLIEKGLMFGNLVPVTSAALAERYNRALKELTGKTTKLSDFHIDQSGYSPEVGEELGDHLYLNPNGCNREFILLSTEQKTAPLLGAKFSFSRAVLRRFIEVNEPKLFALTTRDAVAGELANSVFNMTGPERLEDIRHIAVEADTTAGDVADARELTGMIDRFRTEDDAWWDDVLIAGMIGLARKTGDVTRNPVDLQPVTVDVADYWTTHFGGVYLFRGVDHPAAICAGDVKALKGLPIKHRFGLDARNQIARFLDLNHLVEPIVKARNVDAAAILRQKMDFILVDAAASAGEDLGNATRRDLRILARSMGPALPEAFHGLADLVRWVEGGGHWPKITSEHPAYFYTLRARAHRNRDLVNQLLAELTPLDVRQLFICHKELFYQLYRGWDEAKRGYVADFLEREYQVDKAGTRAALFGPEPGMQEPAPVAEADKLIALVGPWGAVRRN